MKPPSGQPNKRKLAKGNQYKARNQGWKNTYLPDTTKAQAKARATAKRNLESNTTGGGCAITAFGVLCGLSGVYLRMRGWA